MGTVSERLWGCSVAPMVRDALSLRPANMKAARLPLPKIGRKVLRDPPPLSSRTENTVLVSEDKLGSKPLKIAAPIVMPSMTIARSIATTLPQEAAQCRNNGGRDHPGIPGAYRPVVIWFRGDLRLHDNEALVTGNAEASSLLPIYCFDPREYGKSHAGYSKTGPSRAKFILESIRDLRGQFRELGSDLIVRMGRPEEVIPALVQRVQARAVYCQAEVTKEDAEVECAVERAVNDEGAAMKKFWGGTLQHIDDLPFSMENLPQHYGEFHNQLDNLKVQETLAVPSTLRSLPLVSVEPGEIPSLRQLGIGKVPFSYTSKDKHAMGGLLLGGERQGKEMLRLYINDIQSASNSSRSRASALNSRRLLSCGLSAWLATGCLSPRFVYQELLKLGGSPKKTATMSMNNKLKMQADSSILILDLLNRDFFRFHAKRKSVIHTKRLQKVAVA